MFEKITNNYLNEIKKYLKDDDIISSKPPKIEMGDIAFALFSAAKKKNTNPVLLAKELEEYLNSKDLNGKAKAFGPYINIFIDIRKVTEVLFKQVKEGFGSNDSLKNRKIMIEFSCPNTNKPLHLGHLRNNCLGESLSRILKANSADVKKVNLINDRGIHICKSMLAYKEYANNEEPSENLKGDHLVGKYYVKYAALEKEDPSIIEKAQELLIKWEENDREVIELWSLLNKWTIQGLNETYKKTNVSFDKFYYESQTYKSGKQRVLDGFKKGLFYKEEDGSIWVDLSEINLDKKVLLRKDGTSLYITQDIGTAIERHQDWPFDSLIYIVASEQEYHFKVLFYILEKLGYSWAKNLHHLSYGMVYLPDGKMKSREGTVVDVDDLLGQLSIMAKDEIIEKQREKMVNDLDKTSLDIALGAIYYYLLQVQPQRDMTFKQKESLAFNGNTGPYLQYMGARMSSILRNYKEDDYKDIDLDASFFTLDEERTLILLLDSFKLKVKEAAQSYNPAIICSFLYDLCKGFSSYYQEYPILKSEDKKVVKNRVKLISMSLCVLKEAFNLVGIPYLEVM